MCYFLHFSSQKEEYVESGPSSVRRGASKCTIVCLRSVLYGTHQLFFERSIWSSHKLFPAEVIFDGRVRRIGAHHSLVPVLHGKHRRPPHLCLPFCSNSSCLLQMVSCGASVARRTWAPTVHMEPKLLHEGKTAATRARSCGHYDSLHGHILSLQCFILVSLWADNLSLMVVVVKPVFKLLALQQRRFPSTVASVFLHEGSKYSGKA